MLMSATFEAGDFIRVTKVDFSTNIGSGDISTFHGPMNDKIVNSRLVDVQINSENETVIPTKGQ
jgi:hypothetical protein